MGMSFFVNSSNGCFPFRVPFNPITRGYPTKDTRILTISSFGLEGKCG